MAARGRFRGRSQGPERKKQWISPADQGYVAVSSTGTTLVGSFDPVTPSGLDKATMVRTRGMVSVRPAAFGADVNIIGAFGIGIVTNQAFAIGVTGIPAPFDDAEWGGWFVWRSFAFRMEFATAAALNVPASLQFEIDSKAMRKFLPNETMVIVAQSQGGAFEIATPLRHLLLLA